MEESKTLECDEPPSKLPKTDDTREDKTDKKTEIISKEPKNDDDTSDEDGNIMF